ncbi:sugar kinase [candidate division KSB3 bacterium]|uniref:Sugar kinase n=1 Tax=candidate division KSB3 bacterium TaxID=2044937 RepID=A0A9D5Q5U6_9BACT|nr:sugar kinase [candidate division KSB3 bacterium]MBD3324718.1 sugar kinase [candidate division KSB3 bacterium]
MSRHPVEVASFGEPLIGIYPPLNCSLGDDVPLSKTWGGDTSNAALALSKLGHTAAYVTRVGDDGFGQSFLKLWRAHGVDTSQVTLDHVHRTGLYFISYQDGQHQFTYYRKDSAASWISAEDIDWEFLREVRVLHLSGISQAISRQALDVAFDLLHFAREHQILISYDVNYRPPLWRRDLAKAVITHTIEEYADILALTDEEMQFLGWGTTPETLTRHLRRVPALCAVKMGTRGSYLYRDGSGLRVPAFPIDAVDTVGAGDTFDSGLIVGVLEAMEFEDLAAFANAAAALTCRDVGPLRAQPSREEVEQLLQGQGGEDHA